MSASPSHIVRRADGVEAGALYDLPHQGMVCLHLEDAELALFLKERRVLTPSRPPFLDARDVHAADSEHEIGGHAAAHGAYVTRPQVNWFLFPPVEDVAAALEAALDAAGAGYEIAPTGADAPSVTRRDAGS